MFEKFTDRARRVVVLAQEEARMLNHDFLGTEHLLLGIVCEGEGVAAKALESLGISGQVVRQQVEEIIGQGQQEPSGHIPLHPWCEEGVSSFRCVRRLQLGHNYVGTEHILLGLIRQGRRPRRPGSYQAWRGPKTGSASRSSTRRMVARVRDGKRSAPNLGRPPLPCSTSPDATLPVPRGRAGSTR